MRFNTNGTQQASLCGLAPTGKRVGVPVVSVMKFTEGQWQESWTFADELGLLLQLGAPDVLLQSPVPIK